MENQFTTDNLSGKYSEDLNLDIEKLVNKAVEVSDYPNWDRANAAIQNKLQLVFKRLKLYSSFSDDEIVKLLKLSTDEVEIKSLKTYLLLSCVNLLGEISRSENSSPTFLSWLDTSNSVTIKSIREESINKALSSIGVIDDQVKAVKLIKSVFAQYRLNNSVESNFFSFFTDALDNYTQNKIATSCWIYQDNPLERWANLQNVKEGYNNTTSNENKRLTNSRKRWDSLDTHQKLYEISQFVEAFFNQYNLCQTNTPIKLDKDPVAKVWRDIDKAVGEYKVNYLSNSLFNQLGSDGQKFKFNEVKCVFKDEELIVFEGDVREKDRELWLKRLAEWLKTKIDSENTEGETLFLPSKNQALVIVESNLNSSLDKWIDAAIKNILGKS